MSQTQLPHARATWRKSSYSGQQGECVELADLDSAIGVRDSKDPSGPVLRFDRSALAALTGRIRSGQFDL